MLVPGEAHVLLLTVAPAPFELVSLTVTGTPLTGKICVPCCFVTVTVKVCGAPTWLTPLGAMAMCALQSGKLTGPAKS